MMPVLQLEHVSRRFGGNVVLRDVNLAVADGQRVAIIGPNGAGKSTLFDTISGRLAPSGGRILLDGLDISSLSPQHRVRRGIGRSFQLTSLFSGLSVLDNLLLALQGPLASRPGMYRPLRDDAIAVDRARELLGAVDLWQRREAISAELAYGEQKRLEIVMTLALNPRILLLDEPTAGLSLAEVRQFMDLVRSLAAGTSLLFTEHDMDVVFGLAERIGVLHGGVVAAIGSPDEIRAHPKVREIYLGPGGSSVHGP